MLCGMFYDLAIIGGGPAGVAAGVYAARKKLKTVFITKDFGGQSNVSTGIENWIGTVRLDGVELAKNLEAHLRVYAADTVDIRAGEWVARVEKVGSGFRVTTDAGAYDSRSILVATGSSRRKLPAKGADRLEHRGITYCASCDGPLFSGMDVAVVGGGNAAFETALQLLAYCKSVTLLNRTDTFRADEITVAAAKAKPNFRVLTNVTPSEVVGESFVTGIKYKDATGNETLLPVAGIFVEIGLIPNSGWVGSSLDMNEIKQIKVDPRTQRTSHPRVWAAGDITDGVYHQNNIAAGDAVKALEDIYMFVHKGVSTAH